MSSPAATVIIRCKDKISTLGSVVDALRAQTIPVEVLVVDSGSIDGSLELARERADQVVEIARGSFTYGGALNTGAEHARGAVHFALSAHSLPTGPTWVERHLAHYADPEVAAVNGERWGPQGQPLDAPYRQKEQDAVDAPFWGFSNTAASWRPEVWREHPFRDDVAACEDKEWSWRVLRAGRIIVYDPMVVVRSDHRREEGLRQNWARVQKEHREMARLGVVQYPHLTDAGAAWWSQFPHPSPRPRWVRRLSPHRAIEVFGAWSGARKE